MAMPSGIGIIDTMLDLPFDDVKSTYEFLAPQLRDKDSKEEFEFPVEYMFKQVPEARAAGEDPVEHTLALMDHFGIDKALIGSGGDASGRALQHHPDRFLPSIGIEPNDGMKAVESIVKAYETVGLKALAAFPAGCHPQVPINDKRRRMSILANCSVTPLRAVIW